MHGSAEQDFMNLFSTSTSTPPNSATTTSIMNSYISSDLHYDFPQQTISTTDSNAHVFWESPGMTTDTIIPQQQSIRNSSSTSTLNEPIPASKHTPLSILGFHGIMMDHQEQQKDQRHSKPIIMTPTYSTPVSTYLRTSSHSYQRPNLRPSPSTFYHRASLPNIYSTTDTNASFKNISDTFILNTNDTFPLLTWKQSIGHSNQHLRPHTPLDESTRKRTKSMDSINGDQMNIIGQQHQQKQQDYHPDQFLLYHPTRIQQHPPQIHSLQQPMESESDPLAGTIAFSNNMLGSDLTDHFVDDISSLSTLYQHQQSNIKSSISTDCSSSTISSTATLKPVDDDLLSSNAKKNQRYSDNDNDDNDDVSSIHSTETEIDDSNGNNVNDTNRSASTLLSPPSRHSRRTLNSSTASPSPSSSSASSSSSSSPSSNTSASSMEYDYPALNEADLDAATRDASAMPRRQNPRYEHDVYTPRWVRYTGQLKQGYCESCQPMGKWLQLKNSAYWYHKQFFHGISSVSGQPFAPPLEQRINKESDLLEGLCHQCLQFVPICNTKRKNSVLWYRHAHKCHIYDKPKTKLVQSASTKQHYP